MSTVVWPGKDGRTYECELYPIGTNFNAVSACYIFTRLNTENRWVPIYIGETSDLSERFDNHHAMPCITDHGATHRGLYTKVDGNQNPASRRPFLCLNASRRRSSLFS